GPIYNEFTVRTPRASREVLAELEEKHILGGVPLDHYFDDRSNEFLVAVTELHTKEHLDHFADALIAAASKGRS
ncbi:MAG TPA: hypothetical protein VMS12_05855, partial [Thermoanaerobaculia bacterium]|nr:hypothetical protein [Thermoanaerobaculia bacterium]